MRETIKITAPNPQLMQLAFDSVKNLKESDFDTYGGVKYWSGGYKNLNGDLDIKLTAILRKTMISVNIWKIENDK